MIEKLLNFIKTILILLFFTFSFVKIYILINKSLDIVLENNKISNEKMLEIEREKAFSMVETEKTKQEYNIKLAKIENEKIIIKACYDNKEIINFINCVKELRSRQW